MQQRIWLISCFFKKLENGTAPVTQDSAVDKACSKLEIQKFKRSLKNDNTPRTFARSQAAKNSMWYDISKCNRTWSETMSHFLKLVNNKLCIRTCVRANALIVCMDTIEKELCIKLSDLYEIYATESEFERI